MSRRVTGRFYLVLAVIAVVAFLVIRQVMPGGVRLAEVLDGSTSDTRRIQAVIVRDEVVAMTDANSTVFFIAPEGGEVAEGDEIAEVYSAAYSIKEINNLEKIRQDIRDLHANILKTIVDTELDRLNNNVTQKALEMKLLLNGNVSGNFANMQRQLTDAMQARQRYLAQNRREDARLNALYDEENKQETRIANWRQLFKADRAGVVSFYLDGREQFLSPGRMEEVSAGQLRDILGGWTPDIEQLSRQQRPLFRVVNPSSWYLLLVTRTGEISATDGQQFRFQLEGFPDIMHVAVVENISPDGRDTIITLRVLNPMGPLLNQRAGWAVVSIDLQGLLVPNGAIVYQYDQSGVMRYDGVEGVFVPVQILTQDGSNSLIRPIAEDALWRGSRVIVH